MGASSWNFTASYKMRLFVVLFIRWMDWFICESPVHLAPYLQREIYGVLHLR